VHSARVGTVGQKPYTQNLGSKTVVFGPAPNPNQNQ
jgi:hypothetical protein